MDVCDRTDPEAFTDLPPFNQMTPVSFTWGESMSGEDFIHAVTSAYAEVVHWHHNLFLLPSGRAGKRFTSELARMFRVYAEGSTLESIALKAEMVMPALLLQKPHAMSKAREHVTCLQRRLEARERGDINSLVTEGRVEQHRLKQSSHYNSHNT